MLAQFRRRRREEDGAYAVLFVIVLGVFVMAGALAVDIGQLYMTRHATQSVADMAATAGGLALEPTTGGTPRDGCLDAWAYAVDNLPDAPNSRPTRALGCPLPGSRAPLLDADDRHRDDPEHRTTAVHDPHHVAGRRRRPPMDGRV
jgi:hypothetical protein